MKRRLVLTMLATVVLLLLTAPAAFASLSSINPATGVLGETVSATVYGSFRTGSDAQTPHFNLTHDAAILYANTQSWDANSAVIKFTLPFEAAGQGWWTVNYSQEWGFLLPPAVDTGALPAAFRVTSPAPTVTGVSPGTLVIGGGDTPITVDGTNFQADMPDGMGGTYIGTKVRWNGTQLDTTYLSATQVAATIPGSYLTAAGTAYVSVITIHESTLSNDWAVSVVIPRPNPLSFSPPAGYPAGSPASDIHVYGDHFFPAGSPAVSTVTFDDVDMVTTYVSATELIGVATPAMLSTAGTHALKVRNGNDPTTWNLSYGVAFPVTTPAPGTPMISGISPTSIAAGSPTQPITVNGMGFTPDAVVYWNSTALSTTSVTPGIQLSASVPASLLATAGTFNITVHNGTGLGAPVSAPWAYTVTSVTPGGPSIVSLSPTSATAGGAAFPLTVNGTGFIASSVVVWTSGGSSTDLATTFVSATQLTAQVPASLIATAGTATVTVRNGGAGSPVSAAVSFTITGGGGGGTFALSSLEPTQVYVGYVGPGILLTVNGSGFLSGAHIWLGTQEKTNTTFVSATKLTTTLLPADLASVGTIQVSVKNPPAVASPSTLPLAVSNETTDPTVTIQGADSGWHNRPVTLTFAGSDPQSGVQKVQYRCPPAVGSWTTGTTYTVPASTQGEITVSAQVLDWCDRVGSASAVVKIDITRPIPDALNAVSVKRGKVAKLRFRVSEPAGLSPTATVLLQVKKGRKVVMSKTLSGVPMNATEQYSFRAAMTKGSYAWYVSARDEAGNVQAKADKASFRVN